jgi:hypothetical protein
MAPFDIRRLRELYSPDPARIATAKARQAAVWRGERPDRWPILLTGTLTPAQQAIPNPNFLEAFEDVDLMICSQVRQACAVTNAASDAVPSVRGNYGTGQLLSCLGLEQEVFPDKMPWLKQHLTRERIARLTPDDVRVQGTFARGLQFMRRCRDLMGEAPPLYCMDTQGPLGLTHLLFGDDLFYALYDDPPLVHHALEICVEASIRAIVAMKEISGERADECHHTNNLYAPNLGIRICEDSTVMLGPDAIQTFAMPYTRRLARRFGGAWVHYCGRHDGLTAATLAAPEVRGINFGHVHGHEHDHVFEDEMRRCLEAGKVYYGAWPRRPGESGRDYLRRLYGWASQGGLIPIADAALGGPNGFACAADAVDFWYSLE